MPEMKRMIELFLGALCDLGGEMVLLKAES
jgi:hypothetical protein